ncbi:MAG: serpin family protein [Burkholderiaceae bacterium]|nr:serpin family protein [Burkholderiaceae bacterium]MDH3461248.1 serpin family protein [Burkholderiaceae bacterium]
MRRLTSLFALACLLPLGAVSAPPPVAVLDPQQVAVIGNNAFAVELYGQLRSQSGNLFFAPASISTALAMTYAGAKGATADEIANTLHFTLPADKLHPAMGALQRGLNAQHDGYQLRLANAVWIQQGYTLIDEFLALTSSHYGAGLHEADFTNAAEAARLTINQWVESQTQHKIKDMLQPGTIKPATRIMLTNAIYFKGDWKLPFNKEATRVEEFQVAVGSRAKTPLMQRTAKFNYLDGGTFQALELPYKGGELSMVVLLPNASDGMPNLEQSLSPAKLQQWLNQLTQPSEVTVTLPKFKIEATFQLSDSLQALGMKQPFDPELADFSGIAPREQMQHEGNLYLDNVIHKAFVDVNEQGSEAAAATSVAIAKSISLDALPIIFRADHPFVFLIRDNRSGAILVMGRLTDPSK